VSSVLYDPRACGAKCDLCPLNGSTVVPPEQNVGPSQIAAGKAVAVVGEAPSEAEESQGRPFVGANGMELDRALRQARLKRRDLHVTTVILCNPPGKRLKDFLDKISRYNRKQEKAWQKKVQDAQKAGEPIPTGSPDRINSPIDCCAPRLQKELENFDKVITMGTYAYRSVTGMGASLMSVRGGVTTLEPTDRTPGRVIMPTLSPSFVLAVPRWSHVFRNDIHKAGQWFRGETEWVPPNITYHPSADELAAFLSKKDMYTYDIETDGIESLTARIRCIGIGDGENVMVAGFLGKDGHTKFYDRYEEKRVREVLSEFFANPAKMKAGHNSGMYDKLVIRNQWGVTVEPNLDTILLHRCVESELPHSLGFVGSMYTVAPSWKTDREGNKLAFDAESDEQLHTYCANDVSITARVIQPLVEQVRLREQTEVFKVDTRMQAVCADMHEVGMFVDQAKRLEIEKQMLSRRYELLTEIRDRLDWDNFNPGSVYQVREVLFEKWKLEPPLEEKERLTQSGDPSTADLVLRSLLSEKTVDPDKREIIKLLRYYRKVQKTLGTYVTKLRPWNMSANLGWDEDEDWVDRETRKKYGEEKKGIVNPYTGRMYPGYNGHVTTTGRLSSSKPINCFDAETEILTEEGWVRFDSLSREVRVAQWHPDGKIDFVLPSAYHEGKLEGEMVAFRNQSSDLLMTRNHRIPLRKDSGRLETVTAEDLLSLGAGRHTIHAGALRRPDIGVPFTSAELRFLVAIHADGSFVKTAGVSYGLDVGFRKQRKGERFEQILSELPEGYSWSKGKEKNRYRFYLSSVPRLEKLLSLIGRERRRWGPWLFSLNEEQASIFENELWHWDGCLDRRSQYANRDEANADWIQAFLCTRGIRANKRFYTNKDGNSVWIIDVRRTTTNAVTHRSERKVVTWSDTVYCVTVPSDAIVVRRKGKVTITRQSQNVPKALRAMVVAQPGHVLVGADMDQLELRIAAARWEVELYLKAFRDGKDPHSMTAFAVFGEEFCKAAGLDPAQFDRPGPLSGDAYINGKFEGSGDCKKMRDLSKAVQYASVGEGEKVAVLDERASVPIEEVKPGDWLWSWSNERLRYEPSQAKHVWHHGNKECVEVTFTWGQGDIYSGSVIVTADHPMILRNGKLRHAGSLQAGDRLMPFRRRGDSYRLVHPFNDKRMAGEHRVVCGFYDSGEGSFHVHHLDENPLNNVPGNLETKSQRDHYFEHKESLDSGRVRSEKWRASVSDSATRSAASKKAWEGRRTRKDKDKTFGPRGSVLDEFSDKVGMLTDKQVAELAGCTASLVGQYRKKHNIPPPVGQKGWLRWLLTHEVLWNRLLHDNTDVEMVQLVEDHFGVTVHRTAVRNTRKLLGVPAIKKNRKEVHARRCSKLEPWAESIGHKSDQVIAEEAGCSPETVRYYRKMRGIPSFWKEAPEGTNHKVVSVTPVGNREVWDIEVDHEDHNFALASGIFVHNSQYMATVETVHKLICKTEIPSKADDGTTELPYALLPLRRVRKMRDNWLEGAKEFETGWEKEIADFRTYGYLKEPIHGRRRDFLDGENPNEIVNFPIQSQAAALMNNAILQLHEQIPLHKWGKGTGIINQCHDSIVVECPESEAENVARLLEECMNQTHEALPGVEITATAGIGKTWKEVG